MKNNYFLNVKTGKLHIIESKSCPHTYSKNSKEYKLYKTIDEAIADETRYFSYCKRCFKNEI